MLRPGANAATTRAPTSTAPLRRVQQSQQQPPLHHAVEPRPPRRRRALRGLGGCRPLRRRVARRRCGAAPARRAPVLAHLGTAEGRAARRSSTRPSPRRRARGGVVGSNRRRHNIAIHLARVVVNARCAEEPPYCGATRPRGRVEAHAGSSDAAAAPRSCPACARTTRARLVPQRPARRGLRAASVFGEVDASSRGASPAHAGRAPRPQRVEVCSRLRYLARGEQKIAASARRWLRMSTPPTRKIRRGGDKRVAQRRGLLLVHGATGKPSASVTRSSSMPRARADTLVELKSRSLRARAPRAQLGAGAAGRGEDREEQAETKCKMGT